MDANNNNHHYTRSASQRQGMIVVQLPLFWLFWSSLLALMAPGETLTLRWENEISTTFRVVVMVAIIKHVLSVGVAFATSNTVASLLLFHVIYIGYIVYQIYTSAGNMVETQYRGLVTMLDGVWDHAASELEWDVMTHSIAWIGFLVVLLGREIKKAVILLTKRGRKGDVKVAAPRFSNYEEASLLSRLTCYWIAPLFKSAAQGVFIMAASSKADQHSSQQRAREFHQKISQLPRLPSILKSYENMLVPGNGVWRTTASSSRRVFRLLYTLSQLDGGKEFLWVCIPLKIVQDLLSLASYSTIHSVMQFVEKSDELSTFTQVLIAGGSVCAINLIVRFVQAVMFQTYLVHLYTSSLKVTTALKALITKSVLTTPAFAFSKQAGNLLDNPPSLHSSEALSLITVDAERCGECMIFLHNTWSHPIIILLGLGNMCRCIGILPTSVTLIAMLCAIPLNKKSSALVKIAKKNAPNVVARVSDLMVALPVMRIIHAMSLQSSFVSRIEVSRRKESENFRSVIKAEAEAVILTEITMIGIYIVCFGSYFFFGTTQLSVSSLMPAAASLSILRFPIWAAPNLITQLVNGYEAASRIEAFMSRETSQRHSIMECIGGGKKTDEEKHCQDGSVISCRKVDFYWYLPHSLPDARPVLKNINLTVYPGELVVIKGPTGSGKTSLLLALLGELYPHHHADAGNTEGDELVVTQPRWCFGTAVYCAETPWLGSGSIRQNITMASGTRWKSEEEKSWYLRVLDVCELVQDLQAMSHGDLTEVGNDGGALSGGQKARVALARALFYRRGGSDVFLLDNVLSALDADLQRRIVQRVFNELIVGRGKTLLLTSSVFPSQLCCTRAFALTCEGVLVKEDEDNVVFGSPVARFSSSPEYNVASSPTIPVDVINSVMPDHAVERENVDAKSVQEEPALPSFHLLPKFTDLKALMWTHFGPRRAFLVFSVIVLRQGLYSVTENWMGIWFRLQQSEHCMDSVPDSRGMWWWDWFLSAGACTAVSAFMITYSLWGCITCVVSYWRTTLFFQSFQTAADRLQLAAVTRIFGVAPSYFDKGGVVDHILQVLTKDQSVVDRLVPESVKLIVSAVLQVGAVIMMNMIQYPLYIAVVPIIFSVFYYLNLQYLRLSKQLGVLEAQAQEKSVEVVKNAVAGAVTLRSYGYSAVQQMIQELCHTLDIVSTVSHVALTNDRWVALRLEFLSVFMLATFHILIITTKLFQVVSHRSRSSEGENRPSAVRGSSVLAGLGALGLMNSTQQLGQLCRRLGMLQSQFVSVERLVQLEKITTDNISSTAADEGSAVGHGEPTESASRVRDNVILDVQGLTCQYQRHLPNVLAGVRFSLQRGECIGVIGRSGNGKSSLFNALLRVMDVVKGSIRVAQHSGDGSLVDTANLPLSELRRKYFHLVPQEPVLVDGTIRDNLLLGSSGHCDAKLDDVLSRVGIAETLRASERAESLLDFQVVSGGKNLSAGQRQLLGIARALLCKPSILLLDEVTSKIDEESEKILVQVIRSELCHSMSVILISHKMSTVEALCQRILLVRSGSVECELSDVKVNNMMQLMD